MCRISAPYVAHCPAVHVYMHERGQKTLAVNIPYRGSKGPLHLLIDSTGIKVEGEGPLSAACCACACRVISGTPASIPLTHASMCCRAMGGPKRRVWRKIHLHCPAGHRNAMSREGGR